MPIEPVNMEASSERMSPNMLPVTITSNCLGCLRSCIAALSTYMCVSSTAAYSSPTALTTSRHSCEVSSTFALSTEHSFLLRFSAARKLCVGDAADLLVGVAHGIEAFAHPALELPDAARLAEIDVAGQLAHDQDIEPCHHLGLQRRGAGELGVNARGPQIGEQIELLAESEYRLLGALFARQRVVTRTADRAEQDGIGGSRQLQRRPGQGITRGVVRSASNAGLLHLEHGAFSPQRVEYLDRLGNNFRADAVAG